MLAQVSYALATGTYITGRLYLAMIDGHDQPATIATVHPFTVY